MLRDRAGPAAGTGKLTINCLRPIVNLRSLNYPGGENDPTNFNLYVHCQRFDSRVVWAEFVGLATYVSDGTVGPPITTVVSNNLGRFYYQGSPTVATWWRPLRDPLGGGQYSSITLQVWCRAALSNGKVSSFYMASVTPFSSDQIADVDFIAIAQSDRVEADSRQNPDCREHDPGGSSGGGVTGTNNICLDVTPSTGSKEYRIYRRVDSGPLSLLSSGPVTNGMTNIKECDNAMPVNGGSMCYFVQLLDENGNPSPMAFLGCIDVAPVTPLPVPVLSKIVSSGDENNPRMKLLWFCPPYGVERFEVRVAGLPTLPNTNGNQFCSSLSCTGAVETLTYTNNGTNLSLPFYSYVTPKVGPAFGGGGAAFLVEPDIEIGKTYYITIRSLGKNGNHSENSNFEEFVWTPTNVPLPMVPWPARPLPPTNANFFALAFYLSPTNSNPALQTADFEGNAVLIGARAFDSRVHIRLTDPAPGLDISYDPMDAVETNVLGDAIMPFVMYRYQVGNTNFPVVSGDTIQVSPLMEIIAYQVASIPGLGANTTIHDPFVAVTTSGDNSTHNLWLWIKDTQPIIIGARYKYVLVRFKSNHEIDQLIPSNEVEVP